MKAIIEFNLPEESEEFEIYSNAMKYRSALFEIAHNLRSKAEHYSDNNEDVIDYIFEQIAINTEGLDI